MAHHAIRSATDCECREGRTGMCDNDRLSVESFQAAGVDQVKAIMEAAPENVHQLGSGH